MTLLLALEWSYSEALFASLTVLSLVGDGALPPESLQLLISLCAVDRGLRSLLPPYTTPACKIPWPSTRQAHRLDRHLPNFYW
jgi:hypothetical protein